MFDNKPPSPIRKFALTVLPAITLPVMFMLPLFLLKVKPVLPVVTPASLNNTCVLADSLGSPNSIREPITSKTPSISIG